MIRALMVIWSLDPSGAGTATVQPALTVDACYVAAAARADLSTSVSCISLTDADMNRIASVLDYNRCTKTGATAFTCRGRK